MKRSFVLLFGLLLATTAIAQGRFVPDWSYEKMLQLADIVVVVEPTANENNLDRWEWQPELAQGVTTTFRVWCYLKGGPLDHKTIRVKHFIYTHGEPLNGGTMINFLVSPIDVDATYTIHGKSEPWHFEKLPLRWLAFLKRTPEGFYTPVSGQVDPSLSFEELHDVSMFDPTHGMTGGP